MKAETVFWVSLPIYTVGIVVVGDKVIAAPPIAKWTVGKPWQQVERYFRGRGARIEEAGK